MGKILYNNWSVLTDLAGIEWSYRGHTIGLSGMAQVEYQDDEIDTYKGVEFPDDGEPNCLKITFDGKQLTDDGGQETDLFNTVYDLVLEIVESEIDISNTDVTSSDFQLYDGDWSEMDDLLETVTV